MPTNTLKELHTLARAQGLRGYSKLSRRELEKFLSLSRGKNAAATKKAKAAAPKKTASKTGRGSVKSTAKSARTRASKKIAAATARPVARDVATPALVPKWEWVSDIQRQSTEEEQVESAKYATVLPGGAAPRAEAPDLGEDIDNLPSVTEPTLCLLPQKPGVLHGYWIIPPNSEPYPQSLKLRLGRIAGDTFEIIEEIMLPHERGRWYFHVDETSDHGAVYLQLGYYDPGGRFVTAIRRGIARIPSLYASDRTDRLWWVSEEQFRSMYRRAGGQVRGPRLGWAASISSPGGAARAPSSERLAWPGNISSQR